MVKKQGEGQKEILEECTTVYAPTEALKGNQSNMR